MKIKSKIAVSYLSERLRYVRNCLEYINNRYSYLSDINDLGFFDLTKLENLRPYLKKSYSNFEGSLGVLRYLEDNLVYDSEVTVRGIKKIKKSFDKLHSASKVAKKSKAKDDYFREIQRQNEKYKTPKKKSDYRIGIGSSSANFANTPFDDQSSNEKYYTTKDDLNKMEHHMGFDLPMDFFNKNVPSMSND